MTKPIFVWAFLVKLNRRWRKSFLRFRGRVMNAIIAEGQEAAELESGGFVPDSTFNMKFLESELDGEYPHIGEVVEYNGKQFRIHWVSVRVNRGQVEITLKPIDK